MEKKREIYREKAEARFEQMNARIEELLAKFNAAKADARLKINNQFEDLTERRETVIQKMKQLNNAGEDAWQDMRSGLDKALDDLEHSFNQATHKFENLI